VDIAAELSSVLRDSMAVGLGAGVAAEQLIGDPGPVFAKTPA